MDIDFDTKAVVRTHNSSWQPRAPLFGSDWVLLASTGRLDPLDSCDSLYTVQQHHAI